MHHFDRRKFLSTASLSLSIIPISALPGCGLWEPKRGVTLVPTGDGPFALAEGLTQLVLDKKGNRLSDGFVSPARPDGMGCFADAAGRWVLMRNHEIDLDDIGTEDGIGAYELDAVPDAAYTDTSLGAVTRLVVDPATLSVIESNVVLSGTRKNCAGGPTPMGWLSCEETVDDNGIHGFVFLCDINATSIQAPERIDAYGRFYHECAGFDPETGICYLTEDHPGSCLYRFLPDNPSRPFEGKLQALAVSDAPKFATTTMRLNDRQPIEWVDVPDPFAGRELSKQCQDLGAAVIVRGEGCWFDGGRLVFAATGGGLNGRGQIFELKDTSTDAVLSVLAEATEDTPIYHPDNLVIGPDGSVWFAEDNKGDCLIQRLSPDGLLEPVARNTERGEEIAGLCFSPDGKVLFANIQEPGITVAITGF